MPFRRSEIFKLYIIYLLFLGAQFEQGRLQVFLKQSNYGVQSSLRRGKGGLFHATGPQNEPFVSSHLFVRN